MVDKQADALALRYVIYRFVPRHRSSESNRNADYFEVALLVGACFLVNYVMQDSKTNMSEGLTMISFYVMIVSQLSRSETTISFSLSLL